MASSNPFLGLDAATLTTLKSETLEAVRAVLKNQSYSLNGKSVSRADLSRLNEMLGQVSNALDLANDDTTTTSFVSFTGL
jgi:NTP pyrophosphatase (non-canonical NTP hydrolase)